MEDANFLKQFSDLLSSSQNQFPIIGGKELLFEGIQAEDKQLWEELIDYGDDRSIQNVLKAGKTYLLTRVIGNPENPLSKMMKNNEVRYGNTMLHNRMINAHDQSIVKITPSSDGEREKLLKSNCSGADYLLRFYEMKQANALKASCSKKEADEKRATVSNAITMRDKEGKTPLLLACKNLNQQYALRLIQLDEKGETINLCDKLENRSALHIACIFGMKEVALKLIEMGADKKCTDIYHHEPFYYLSCSDEEKLKHINSVLDSVNFFYGRYFQKSDLERISKQLLSKNKSLQQDLNITSLELQQNLNVLTPGKV